jgi:hypothetical protein
MLSTLKQNVSTSSRVMKLLALLVVISLSVEAVLLLGVVNMFGVGMLILPAAAMASLAAGLVFTVLEFAKLAKKH